MNGLMDRLGRGGMILAAVLLFGLGRPGWAQESDPGNPLLDPLQLLQELEKRRQELDARAERLDRQEADLQLLESRIDKRIAMLQELRAAIEADLARETEIDDANTNRLARIYAGMKPRLAAERLQGLEQGLAIRVLRAMKESVAAKILGRMDAAPATVLADELGMTMRDRRQRQ